MAENKLNVNWYPGHMEKARRDMKDALNQTDMVIEVRDARMPRASRNPLLDQMIKDKPRLIILSKADLADPEATKQWIDALESGSQKALALDLMHDKNAGRRIIEEALEMNSEKRKKMIAKGIRPRPVRAMACGIPNVGKSTLINRTAGKNRAVTADKPGVTRNLLWIHADKNLDILDTPGVLWPRFSDENTGLCLAAFGSISRDILNTEEIAARTIALLRTYYPGLLCRAFSLTDESDEWQVLKDIARTRHLYKPGDEPDTGRAADVFLHELRKAKYGPVTLERPE